MLELERAAEEMTKDLVCKRKCWCHISVKSAGGPPSDLCKTCREMPCGQTWGLGAAA